ncbi:hypothetical protein F5146DRAFT_1117940 [Armillaria mellea]|nr:hypothetical protein F5146DRAFT_1117940 [Armillaria mellea]
MTLSDDPKDSNAIYFPSPCCELYPAKPPRFPKGNHQDAMMILSTVFRVAIDVVSLGALSDRFNHTGHQLIEDLFAVMVDVERAQLDGQLAVDRFRRNKLVNGTPLWGVDTPNIDQDRQLKATALDAKAPSLTVLDMSFRTVCIGAPGLQPQQAIVGKTHLLLRPWDRCAKKGRGLDAGGFSSIFHSKTRRISTHQIDTR